MSAVVLLPILIFLTVAAMLLAVIFLLGDIFRRPPKTDEEILEDPEEIAKLFAREEPHGNLNRKFSTLVSESGTRLDETAILALIVGGGIVGAAIPFVFLDNLLLAAFGLVVGCMLPIAYLTFIRWRRLSRLRKMLPETLEIVADSIRAGRSLQDTFELVAQEVRNSVGKEFEQAAKQLDLGHSILRVLEKMVRRIPLHEFRIFATAVLVHERSGGNLALLTERLAASARDREQFVGHLNAVTAGSRLSAVGLVVGSLIGVAVLTTIEPDYLGTFFTNPYGPTLLVIAATLQIIGIVWVWRVLRVQF